MGRIALPTVLEVFLGYYSAIPITQSNGGAGHTVVHHGWRGVKRWCGSPEPRTGGRRGLLGDKPGSDKITAGPICRTESLSEGSLHAQGWANGLAMRVMDNHVTSRPIKHCVHTYFSPDGFTGWNGRSRTNALCGLLSRQLNPDAFIFIFFQRRTNPIAVKHCCALYKYSFF